MTGEIFTSDREHIGLAPQCARAKDLCFAYNCQVRPADTERQHEILAQLFARVGANCVIDAPFMVDNGFNISVGDNFRSGAHLVILDSASVVIGDNVTIEPHVSITAVGHPVDAQLRNQGIEYAYPITIGSQVDIGAGSCILPGVTIGSQVVIAAGSVVNRNIPSGCYAGGNPCRVQRKLTAAELERHLGIFSGF